MSGISGVLLRDGGPAGAGDDPLDPAARPMARFANGRPPSTWAEGPVALGNADPASSPGAGGEAMPLRHPRRPRVVTADARLDNRDDLARRLGLGPDAAAATGDAALMLAAWDRWGEGCVEHLLGDFAFALWDGDRRALFLARDFIGARPLYYSVDHRRIVFASDIEAALRLGGLEPVLDAALARERLERGQTHAPDRTYFRDLLKLPPGHWLRIDASGVELRRYWSPAAVHDFSARSEDDLIDELRALLDDAVDCRLQGEKTVGAHCSGGLDSSTVAAVAARRLARTGRTLPGISWAPAPRPEEVPVSDERDTLEYLARTLGVQPVYSDLDVDDLVAERIADRTLRPEVTLRWERAASRAAAERGIGVVLSGWGGDETVAFNGRGFFAELFLRGRWLSMMRELRLRAELGSAPWNFKGKVILPLLPDRFADPVIQRARAIKVRSLPGCLAPSLRTRLAAASYEHLNARERPGVRRMQETLIENGHLTERIESWYDHGVDRGIEYRYPLLDRRVVEFALAAPPWFSFRNGWKRHGFRRLAEGLLPDETRWRLRKADPAMVRHTGPLMEPARQRLVDIVREREAEIRDRGFLDYDRFLAGLEIPIGDSRNGPPRADTPGGLALDAWLAFSTGTIPE